MLAESRNFPVPLLQLRFGLSPRRPLRKSFSGGRVELFLLDHFVHAFLSF